jgi:hypothetical protein
VAVGLDPNQRKALEEVAEHEIETNAATIA